MQNYIQNNNYIPVKIEDVEEISVPHYERFIVSPNHPSYPDAASEFSQEKYQYPYLPLCLGEFEIDGLVDFNILRLIIRENSEHAKIYLPKPLLAFKDFILETVNYHRQFYSANKNCFLYLTVRTSTYESLYYRNSMGWHIDGFQGARIKRHIIEQNAFWCNNSPTEYSMQPFFCEHLNPALYDINDFFNTHAQNSFIVESKAKHTYFVNPYNVHRVKPERFEGSRFFVRLNFSPVLIEDHTNTPNPALAQYQFEPRRDVRDFLRAYRTQEHNGYNFPSK